MNKKNCGVCENSMGNSLNTVLGVLVHKHCQNQPKKIGFNAETCETQFAPTTDEYANWANRIANADTEYDAEMMLKNNFISRKAVLSMIEGMEVKIPDSHKYTLWSAKFEGYNQALRDLLNKIQL